MPCSNARARRLLKSKRAIKRWFKGIFAIKLIDREGGAIQPVAVGVDPGSKREGFTVKSEAHTYLNVQSEAVTHVSDKITTRREMRRARRFRKTPCRQNRINRKRGGLPPSTKARWQAKLRILNFLAKLYPVSVAVVEDVAAVTKKGKRKWNVNFSSLEVGKIWFYAEIEKRWRLVIKQGHETHAERLRLGLTKSKNKLAETFSAHCVDSWALANMEVGGHEQPENTKLILMTPLNAIRRQLHRLQPAKGGVRHGYGGTQINGFKKLSIVKHVKLGIVLIGGSGVQMNSFSLNSPETGKTISRSRRKVDVTFFAYNSFALRAAR